MFRPRVIPVLLLENLGLVKTIKFRRPKYVGDPINAVKIFNDLKADELIFVDISATRNNRLIPLKLIKEVGEEAFMPFAVGGGISSVKEAEKCIKNGAEKIILGYHAVMNPDFINECAKTFGSQSVVVSVDVKRNIFGKSQVYINNGRINSKYDPISWSINIENSGAGEIFINDINNEGMRGGYDLNLIKLISKSVNIPVVACGGAGKLSDLKSAIDAGAHAVAAGSIFVYQGPRMAVLINYPNNDTLLEIFQ